MKKITVSLSLLLCVFCSLALFPVSADRELSNQTAGTESSTYSIVHLSDTQNLATSYPDIYNYTFSYLDSIRDQYNISAIIVTGDLVNTHDSQKEWTAYANAVRKTSIPLYVIAGNHDTAYGKDYTDYSRYAGHMGGYYLTSINDFTFVGIDYTKKTLPSSDFKKIQENIQRSAHNFTIIATHYYMNPDGSLSELGSDIDKKLIDRPTLVLTGHKSGAVIKTKQVAGSPVIADLTDYQNGPIGGPKEHNYSAGVMYTITAGNGVVERITERTIEISPALNLSRERVVYSNLSQPITLPA